MTGGVWPEAPQSQKAPTTLVWPDASAALNSLDTVLWLLACIGVWPEAPQSQKAPTTLVWLDASAALNSVDTVLWLLAAARSVFWSFLLPQTTLPTTPECVSHCLSHWTLGCHELVTHEAQPTTPELVTHEAQPPNCVCE